MNRVAGREQQREEQGDHHVEDDRAQDPEAQDECRIEVQQQDDHRNRGDDGGKGYAPAVCASRESGPPRMAGALGHGDSLAALTPRRGALSEAWTCKHGNAMEEEAQAQPDEGSQPWVRRKLLPRNVKITLMVLLLFFVGEYILLPELASARKDFHHLSQLNFLWLVLGVLLEIGALDLLCRADPHRALPRRAVVLLYLPYQHVGAHHQPHAARGNGTGFGGQLPAPDRARARPGAPCRAARRPSGWPPRASVRPSSSTSSSGSRS